MTGGRRRAVAGRSAPTPPAGADRFAAPELRAGAHAASHALVAHLLGYKVRSLGVDGTRVRVDVKVTRRQQEGVSAAALVAVAGPLGEALAYRRSRSAKVAEIQCSLCAPASKLDKRTRDRARWRAHRELAPRVEWLRAVAKALDAMAGGFWPHHLPLPPNAVLVPRRPKLKGSVVGFALDDDRPIPAPDSDEYRVAEQMPPCRICRACWALEGHEEECNVPTTMAADRAAGLRARADRPSFQFRDSRGDLYVVTWKRHRPKPYLYRRTPSGRTAGQARPLRDDKLLGTVEPADFARGREHVKALVDAGNLPAKLQ